MKIIITESQFNLNLIRRINLFEKYLKPIMGEHDPCDYIRIDQYKRIVLNDIIQQVIADNAIEGLFNSAKDIFKFRDSVLVPLFSEKIKDYYYSFEGECD